MPTPECFKTRRTTNTVYPTVHGPEFDKLKKVYDAAVIATEDAIDAYQAARDAMEAAQVQETAAHNACYRWLEQHSKYR